jgi:4-amino-4-deoxy-L-arabinose transferase-like glycosyltransferase
VQYPTAEVSDVETETPPATTKAPVSGRFWFGLGAITLAGLILRFYIVLVHRPTAIEPGGSVYVLAGDAFYYHWQGIALADGLGFIDSARWQFFDQIEASAAHVPVYSLYLGAVSLLGFESVTAHRLASSVLGAASIVVIALVARRLAGNRAALIAAGIAALYPELWINDGMLLTETMAIFTVGLVVLAAYRLWDRRDLLSAVLVGAAIAVAGLTRSEEAFLFVVMAVPLVLFMRIAWKRRAQLLGAMVVAGLVIVAPWFAWTATEFEHPVLLTTAGGPVLNNGSCDEAYYGEFIGYYANCFRGTPEGDESERDAQARDQAIEYIKDNTGRIPLVVAARVGRLWGLFKPGQTTWLDWWLEGRGRGASWTGLFAYYALLPFAIGGLVVLRRRRVPITPLVALVIVVTIAAAMSFGVTRYRAPAEITIVAAAAVGIDALWQEWSRRRASPARTDAPAPPDTPEPLPTPSPAPTVDAP